MKILFLSDNFPPERNAPAARTFEHSIEWSKQGHHITVITCAPNFPDGKVFPGYENRWHQIEIMEGIRVVRVKTYITGNEGIVRRSLDYLSFMAMSFIAGFFEGKPDIIIGTSPQFFTALSAWLLSIFKRCPFIFEVRDLWPASIVAVGAFKKGAIIFFLEKVEMFLYCKAAKIITVTHSFKNILIKRGIESSKIEVIYNAVDLQRYSPRSKDPSLLTKYQLQNKFVVGYLGTFGMAHALESVIAAADILKDNDQIIFLMVGGGAEKEKLVDKVRNRKLTNVKILPFQPKEQMPAIWSVCDLALVHLKNNPVFSTVIPSKIFEAMGMGIPILLAAPEGEATELVRQLGCGEVIAPESPQQLAAQIQELCANKEKLVKMAKAGCDGALKYSRKEQALKMLAVLSSPCKREK